MAISEAVNVVCLKRGWSGLELTVILQPYEVAPRQKIISSLRRSLEHLPTTGHDHEEHKDNIGLNLLFVPPEPLVDLIFVHGLWGDYQKTWNATRAPSHFWPKEWLSRDPGFKHVRISSYSYDTALTEDFKHNKKDNVASQLGRELFQHLQDSKHISGTGPVRNVQSHPLRCFRLRCC